MAVHISQSIRAFCDTYQIIVTNGDGKGAVDIMLPLDFAYGPKDSENDSPRNKQVTDISDCMDATNKLRSYYAQTYISFDTFKQAAKKIFSLYQENPKGYENFMRYWAHNGEYNWIGNTDEYSGETNENAGYRPHYHFKASDEIITTKVKDKGKWHVKFYGVIIAYKDKDSSHTEETLKYYHNGTELDENGNRKSVDNVSKIDRFENYGAVEIIKHGWNDTTFWINNSNPSKSDMVG